MRNNTLLVLALVLGLSAPAWAASVRVKANGTPLRATASTEGEVVLRLNQGATLEFLEPVRDWYKVRDPLTKKEGFVPASLVDLVPGDVPAAGTSAAGAQKGGKAAPAPAAKPAAPKRPLPPAKPGDWRDKGFVVASGLFQAKGTTFGYTFSPPEYAYAEEARINTHHPVDAGPAFDVGAGWRVWRNMAIGAAVSVFSRTSSVTVDGTVPHPLYLHRDRAVSGAFDSPRTEVGLHVQATWVVPAGRRMLVSFSGGPSYLHLTQAVAGGINLSTVYPYDTSDVTGARTDTQSKGGLGFNAGGEASYFFTRMIGVSGMARFSRASLALPTTGGSVTTNVGGFQAGVGLRLRLGPAGPKTPPKPAKGLPPPNPAKAPPPKPVKK